MLLQLFRHENIYFLYAACYLQFLKLYNRGWEQGTVPVEKGLAKGFSEPVIGQTHLKANDYLKPTVGTISFEISALLQSYFPTEATQLPGVAISVAVIIRMLLFVPP